MSREKLKYYGAGLGLIPGLAANGITSFAPADIQGIPYMNIAPSLLTSRLLSAAASVNLTAVTTVPTIVGRARGYNAKASALFLKIWDKASAVVVGTDIPVAVFRLAATADFDIRINLALANGFSYAFTGAVADSDATALIAADIIACNIGYDTL